MPYGLVIPVATVWLTYRLFQKSNVSNRMKLAAAALALASFFLPRLLGGVAATLLQVALCCGLILYTEIKV